VQLYIGNKNYSSWSMRPWVLMRQAGIAFDEVPLRISYDPASEFKRILSNVNPAGMVPVLVDDGFAVWDTLAIAEYLAEKFPDKHLWPADRQQRARARSLCAEMHSGFAALRSHFPMNIEASLPDVGAKVLDEQEAAKHNLSRIGQMWTEQLESSGGPMLFGPFGIVDAYFAPVCTRIKTYALPVSVPVKGYVDRVLALPAVQAWTQAALAEHDFLDFDEPYRTAPPV